MSRRAITLFVLSVLPLSVACQRHEAPKRASAPPPIATVSSGRGGGGGGGGNGGSGDDDEAPVNPQQRFHDATVYIDGVPTVAFTYNEMPPDLKPYKKEWDQGEFFTHFLVCDYLKKLGADCKDIKETHWYAGRARVAVITGKELRKNRDKLFFNFTREFFGKPRVEWGTEIETNNTVDVVSDLAIYIHKKPPRWDRSLWALIDDQGNEVEGIPYLKEEPKNGVRVNVDGRLVARIKRNLLEGNVPAIDEKDGEPRYSLAAFLDAAKIGAAVRSVDLVTRDERVVHVPPEELRDVSFSAARHQHGAMMMYFGAHFVPAIAINLYARLAPPAREMRTVTLGGGAAGRGVFSPHREPGTPAVPASEAP
jgi:hypothetical protein